MQEWMIAMLVISIMLIIRDMAKTILAENLPDTEELPSLQEGHPQKERVEKYAASFQKLADTFYGMPYRKDYLSSRQVEQIIEDTNAKVCSRCYQREICWGEHSQEMLDVQTNIQKNVEDIQKSKDEIQKLNQETRKMSEASALTGQAYVPVPYSIMRRLQRIFRKKGRT